jgi:hypothetical protein
MPKKDIKESNTVKSIKKTVGNTLRNAIMKIKTILSSLRNAMKEREDIITKM